MSDIKHNPEVETYEGRQDHIRDLQTPAIETFRNIYADRSYRINLEFPEFTAICPKTGLPDFGVVRISYEPADSCLELKSLKEYLTSFRNVGIFHENVVNRVLMDLQAACSPRWMRVRVDYNTRGGIDTSVSARYPGHAAPNTSVTD